MGRNLAAIAAVCAALALAGCAGQSSTVGAGGPDITLAQSKSPVQLLRNEAMSRLPSILAKDVAESSDSSVACLPADEDPDGLSRSWESSLTLHVTNSRAASIPGALDDLVASFVDQGWTIDDTAAPDDAASLAPIVLTSSTSLVTMRVQELPKAQDESAAIRITTLGPCVATDGEGSDEVLVLEGNS